MKLAAVSTELACLKLALAKGQGGPRRHRAIAPDALKHLVV
jgi:hypothetical protein